MSENFVNAMETESRWTKTENDAVALNTTGVSLLDLFGTIGALRDAEENRVLSLFSKAFSEDKLLAVKMSFYARNIRGGLGERKVPRLIWRYLANNYPVIVKKNMHLIPHFGRWDDLYIFVGTPVEDFMWEYIKKHFLEDIDLMQKGLNISLMAKWLKSCNASSKETRRLGRITADKLGLTEKTYRKTLSLMRKHIDVVERKMSSKAWGQIEYERVPSNAMNIYRNAFSRNDADRFEGYINAVSTGEVKINASTLFPYDVVGKYLKRSDFLVDRVLEEQWKALPNYVEGESNTLVIADVSGSMTFRGIRPLATSVGLAIYFAERNKGVFHNKFMTFSSEPEFVSLKGETLSDRVRNVSNTRWGRSTDIYKALKLIVDVAVQNNLTQEDIPTSLIIISDMEFDECTDRKETFHDSAKRLYAEHGYTLPNVIFWNVDSRQDTFHAQNNAYGVQLASGQSQSVFKAILEGVGLTAFEMLLKTLSDPQYDEIRI